MADRRGKATRKGAQLLVAAVVLAGLIAAALTIDRSAGEPLPEKGSGLRPVGPPLPLSSAERERAVAEQRALNRVRRYTRYVIGGIPRRRYVALTFDDGPSPYTRGVLRVLHGYHAPATFFPVGTMMRRYPRLVEQVVRSGNAIGDHTFSHEYLSHHKLREQRREIARQAIELMRRGGRYPQLFRPPYGSYDRNTFRVLRRLDMLMVLWSVDTEDYTRPGRRAIVGSVLGDVKPGAIVLMHDGGGPREQTVAALPAIIRGLRKRGYRLVTVPELLRFDPPSRRQPWRPRLGGF